MPLLLRVVDSQALPAAVELVKLQLHVRRLGSQYVPAAHWSFAKKPEVVGELPSPQADTGGSRLSPYRPLVRP